MSKLFCEKKFVKKYFSDHIILVSLACLFTCQATRAQMPTNNCYADHYKKVNHWTDSIKWKNTINATSVEGLIDGKSMVDSLRLSETIASIAHQGGGVLYFPAGTYYFSYDFYIQDGVVIRGADPINSNAAKSSEYVLPTKFQFPKYHPVFSGSGTPNKTAFKIIRTNPMGVKNAELVNLDINRARIDFFSRLTREEAQAVHDGKTLMPIYYPSNLLLFGIRQNNAVTPDPEIPTKFMIDEGSAWQRWPLQGRGANIDVVVKRNLVIANCRLNDSTTDNFNQPNYLVHSGYKIEGPKAKFKYDFHPAIWVNVRAHGLEIFEGIEIIDNFLVTTSFWDKILVRGKNPVIANNVENGYVFENDSEVGDDGKWEKDLKWKKYSSNDTLFKKLTYLTPKADTIPYRWLITIPAPLTP